MIEGYKDSPLGMVPKNWEIVTVKEITKEHKQGFYTKDGYVSNGIKLARITDLNNPKVNFSEMPMLTISDSDYQNYKIEKGDFLFARSGAIGRYGIVENEEYPAVFASYLIRFRFKSNIVNRYFGYFFESYLCNKQLRGITQGNANVNINAENIKSLKFPFAPFEEQQKIAEILSTVDEKIEVIDQQIIETQALKKGLMQRLLTKGIGHTEFKESPLGMIPLSWEVVKINEVTSYVDYRGKTPPKVNTGVLLVTARNIKMGKIDYEVSKEFIPEELYNSVMSRGVPKIGDVLITTEAPLGNIASVDKENIALAQRVIKYRGNNGVLDNSYLKQYMLGSIFQSLLEKQSTGSTVKGIKGSVLHKLNIALPSIYEQQKIAEILSSVDDKLEVLSEKKTHYQKLKQGLMQQLLTGKIRVKV